MNEKTFRKAIKTFLPKSLFLPLRELWRKIIRFESIEKNQQNLFLQRYKELSKIENPKKVLKNTLEIEFSDHNAYKYIKNNSKNK